MMVGRGWLQICHGKGCVVRVEPGREEADEASLVYEIS
jgi:hypothetical protein